MNLLANCAFACTAAIIYKKKHTFSGAIIGLTAGTLCMTAIMLLWNYLIIPLYMGYPREAVAAMLIPIFLPFNLIKGAINTGITMLLYKPIVTALRKSGLIAGSSTTVVGKRNIGTILISLTVIATGILIALSLNHVI